MTWTDFMKRLSQRRQSAAVDSQPAAPAHRITSLAELRASVSAEDLRCSMSHWDGYIREAALVRCAELAIKPGMASLLPAVVERLNDWVPDIRHLARAVLLELLPAADAPLALAILPAIQRLAGALREDHSAWIARFERMLLDRLGPAPLLEAMRAGDRKLGRACLQLLSGHRAIDARTLALAALSSRHDVVLALRALDAFTTEAGGAAPETRDVYLVAMRSPFGAVRARALRWLLSLSPADVDEGTVIDALVDSQSGARAAAAAYLRPMGFDLRGHYRRQAAAQDALRARRRVTALLSLADLRNADDLDFVRGFTGSANAPLRKAAYFGWLRIAPRDKDGIALAMLRDDAGFIRAAALRVIRDHGAYVAEDAGRELLLARGDIALLLSFVRTSKWSWLECLARLGAETSPEAPVYQVLAASLVDWASQAGGRYEQPTQGQARYLATPACRSTLERLAGERRDAWQVSLLPGGLGRCVAFELDVAASLSSRRGQ